MKAGGNCMKSVTTCNTDLRGVMKGEMCSTIEIGNPENTCTSLKS